jgi:hypothetical protein
MTARKAGGTSGAADDIARELLRKLEPAAADDERRDPGQDQHRNERPFRRKPGPHGTG